MIPSFEIATNYLEVSFLAFVPGIIGVAISIYVWLKIPRTGTTLMFLVFVILCSIWQISEGFLRLAKDFETAFFWNRLMSLAITPALAAGLHFALLFVNHKKFLKSKLFFTLLYFPVILFCGTVILNLNVWTIVKSDLWNWLSDPNLTLLQSIEVFWIGIVAILTMYFLASYALKSRNADFTLRRRATIVFAGYFIPAAIGIICQIIFPQVFGMTEVPIAAPLVISFSIASFIALRKYDLFKFSSAFPANRVLKLMNEGVVIVDNDLKVRYSNSGFSELTGYKRDELLGESIKSLGTGYFEPCKVVNAPIQDSGFKARVTRKILARDGSERIVFYNCADYFDKLGNVTGTILLYSDITEIVQATEKVKCEKKQALRHQSMLLSAQLNPHFIFNSLNSIQHFVMEENREPALNYISEFSKLMRNVLSNSLKEYITISDEISFLEAYLHMELKRLKNKFTYVINVSEEIDIDEMIIPPMLLQPYVENAIVHGLGLSKYEGVLTISFVMENENILCKISDNGIGRESAIELKKNRQKTLNRSHGMSLINSRLDVLNEISQQDHLVHVDDLKDEKNEGIGTKITVTFPVLYS